MMKSIILFAFIGCSLNSTAQVRLGLQSGYSSISETGFSPQLSTTLSIGWQFDNHISWGLQYSTTVKKIYEGNADFYYCDSLHTIGWSSICLGQDSMVNSDFIKTYNVNALGVYLMKHKKIANEKLDLALGMRSTINFLSRREVHQDPILAYDQTDRAIGVSLSPIVRFSYIPYPKKTDFALFVETSTGIFISPQARCEDANCDNFLDRAFNSRTLFQIGISY